MLGNVAEWCEDWYAEDYYGQSAPVDPAGPLVGTSNVSRGGGWNGSPCECRLAYRGSNCNSGALAARGFRVVIDRGPPKAPRPKPTLAAVLVCPTQFDFIETPLQDVVDYLKDLHHIEIQLDQKALAAAGVSTDMPITVSLRGVALRSALRLVTRDLGLTYLVGDGYLLITTPAAVQGWAETPSPPRPDDTKPTPAMTAHETRIQEAMKSPTNVEFIETPLGDVLEYLQDYHEIKIHADRAARATFETSTGKMKDATKPQLVTSQLKGVTLGAALPLIIKDFGLTYSVTDEVLLITPSKQMPTTTKPAKK
jgi:hypothetical protein